MVKVRGVWTPKLNYKQLAETVLSALAFNPSRLTGAEVKGSSNCHGLGY